MDEVEEVDELLSFIGGAVLEGGQIQVWPCQWVADEVSEKAEGPAEDQMLHEAGWGLASGSEDPCPGKDTQEDPEFAFRDLTQDSVQVNLPHYVSLAHLSRAVITVPT